VDEKEIEEIVKKTGIETVVLKEEAAPAVELPMAQRYFLF